MAISTAVYTLEDCHAPIAKHDPFIGARNDDERFFGTRVRRNSGRHENKSRDYNNYYLFSLPKLQYRFQDLADPKSQLFRLTAILQAPVPYLK